MVDFGLKGRRAMVTGAASGIGRATAKLLAAQGCRLVCCDIQQEPLHQLLGELGETGHHNSLTFDLADPQGCVGGVAEAARLMDGLDTVVHAGAAIIREPLDDVCADSMRTLTAINMWGTFFIAREAVRVMSRQGGGSIVLLSSQGAFTGGFAGSTVYAMTKAAVGALIKSLTREFATFGVRVNGVAPGAIETPMLQRDMTHEARERFRKMIPVGRLGEPDEVASCCAFLASHASDYVNGQILHVNGGQLML